MFIADMFIYLVIALYLDAVVPQTYGTRRPFYFFLLPRFWLPNQRLKMKLPRSVIMKGQDNPDLFESPNKEQIQKMEDNKGVRIHDLCKKFGPNFAVQGLNAFFYKNEITGKLDGSCFSCIYDG